LPQPSNARPFLDRDRRCNFVLFSVELCSTGRTLGKDLPELESHRPPAIALVAGAQARSPLRVHHDALAIAPRRLAHAVILFSKLNVMAHSFQSLDDFGKK